MIAMKLAPDNAYSRPLHITTHFTAKSQHGILLRLSINRLFILSHLAIWKEQLNAIWLL